MCKVKMCVLLLLSMMGLSYAAMNSNMKQLGSDLSGMPQNMMNNNTMMQGNMNRMNYDNDDMIAKHKDMIKNPTPVSAKDLKVDDVVMIAVSHEAAMDDILDVNFFPIEFVDEKLTAEEVRGLNMIRKELLVENKRFYEIIKQLGEEDAVGATREAIMQDILDSHARFGKLVIHFDEGMKKVMMHDASMNNNTNMR